jgi:hypothetical protein
LMGCLWHLDLGDVVFPMQFIYLEAYGRQRWDLRTQVDGSNFFFLLWCFLMFFCWWKECSQQVVGFMFLLDFHILRRRLKQFVVIDNIMS